MANSTDGRVTATLREMTAERRGEILERLWSRLSTIFSPRWRSQWRNDDELAVAKAEWMDALLPYTMDVLAKTLEHCRSGLKPDSDGRIWPPTLPEFVAMCRDYSRTVPTKRQHHFDPTNPVTAQMIRAYAEAMEAKKDRGQLIAINPREYHEMLMENELLCGRPLIGWPGDWRNDRGFLLPWDLLPEHAINDYRDRQQKAIESDKQRLNVAA